MVRITRWRLIAVVLGLALSGVSSVPLGAAESDGRVEQSVQQAYHPGSATAPSSAVEDYEGDVLELQAAYVGETAMEPTLGVTSDGTAFFASSSIVVDTPVVYGVAETDTLRSTDGGLTWESVQLKVPAAEKSVIPGNADPFVYVDQATDRIFNIDLYAGCSWLNFSDDLGDSWTPVPAACGNFVNDHHTITSGAPPEGVPTVGYPRVLYYCFNRVIDANCGRSLDGGLTWTPTLEPSFFGYDPDNGGLCGGLHGHVRTDPDGRLLVPKGHCGNPWIAVSDDAGDSWQRVQVSDLRTAGTHLSLDSDSEGNLYFLWWGGPQAEDRLPYLAISRDHGATWSDPIMVAPPGVTEANFPVIAAGDPGHIAITFPSSTSDDRGDNRRPWNQTVAISTNALDEQPVFLSATANDPADPIHRGACSGRCGGLWDFLDITIGPSGELWAAASDDCVGDCVTGDGGVLRAGLGIAIRQVGGPLLRAAESDD